ncbi:hypothetical protein ACP275_11G108100 [Erythranthe tilingii]
MLTDDRWREIQYAVEYAVFAIADPTPRPDPPGQGRFEIEQLILERQPERIAAPIPVPHDWKPAYPLLKHMVGEQDLSQLREQVDRLHRNVIDNYHVRRNKAYLGTAQRYLFKVSGYIFNAYMEQRSAKTDEVWAKIEEIRAKRAKTYKQV